MASESNPAKHCGKLNKIYVENINGIHNFEWTLNPSFNVLHEESFTGSVEVRILIDLIGSICKGKTEKGKFLGNVKDADRPAAIILKETSEETVFHGVFSWQGKAWYFKKCKESLQYQRLGEGKIHERKLDEKESNWEDNTDRMILCLVVHTRSRSAERSEFSIETCTTFIIEGDCPEISGITKTTLPPSGPLEMKNGIVDSEFYGVTTFRFYVYLEYMLKETNMPLVVDLHDKEDVCKILENITKVADDKSVQVLAITDDCSIRTKCQDYNLFVAKCLYDGKSNGFSVVPFEIKGKNHSLKYENILEETCLIVFVENDQENIISCLISLFYDVLCADGDVPGNDNNNGSEDKDKKTALKHMLKNIHVINAAKIFHSFGLPIPHVTVLGEKAICFKTEPSSDRCKAPLAQRILEKALHNKNLHCHYNKLYEKCEQTGKNCKEIIYSAIDQDSYRKILNKFGNICIWEGDNEGDTLKLDDSSEAKLKDELTNKLRDGDKMIKSFKEFLFGHAFEHHLSFYWRLAKESNVALERQMFMAQTASEVGVLAAHFLPQTSVIFQEEIEDTMERHLNNMEQDIRTILKKFSEEQAGSTSITSEESSTIQEKNEDAQPPT